MSNIEQGMSNVEMVKQAKYMSFYVRLNTVNSKPQRYKEDKERDVK
ncbi:MAG: hypothetical protein RLZZ292_164 [Bacteroidota bacterium]|jgi:hypothetical protein